MNYPRTSHIISLLRWKKKTSRSHLEAIQTLKTTMLQDLFNELSYPDIILPHWMVFKTLLRIRDVHLKI